MPIRKKKKVKKSLMILLPGLAVVPVLAATISCSNVIQSQEDNIANEQKNLKTKNESGLNYGAKGTKLSEEFTYSKVKKTIEKLFRPYKDKAASVASDIVMRDSDNGILKVSLTNDIWFKFKIVDTVDSFSTIHYEITEIHGGYSIGEDMSIMRGYLTFFGNALENPTLPTIKGISGAGVLVRSDADILHATTTFKYKKNDNDTYRSFARNDDFTKDNWLQITWTAKDGYVFIDDKGNTSTSVTLERKLDYLLIQDEIDINNITQDAIYMEINRLYANEKAKGLAVAFKNVLQRQVVINGVLVEFTPSKDINNNQVPYVVTKLSKGNAEKVIPTSDVSLNGVISGFKTQAEIDVWKVTQAEIHQKIDALYLNEKPKGLAVAFANIADREVAVNGVKVEYTIAKDAANDALNYVVTKLSKGNAEKVIPTSDVSLNGVISGFKTQAEIDVWKVTQAEIHQKIDALYLNEKPKGLAIAFANIADREVAVNGVKVEYTIAKDAANDALNYVVTKLSKGNAEKVIPTSDVSLNGVISGFKTQAEIDVWKVTQAEIHQKIDALYLNEKPEGIAIAFANIADREVAVNGVKVEYTIAKDAANDALNYVVTKLSKGNAEKVIPTSDVSLNGVISGFKTQAEIDVWKVTQAEIHQKIDALYLNEKPKGLAVAFANIADREVAVNGVKVEYTIAKDAANDALNYVVTKLSKGNAEKVIPTSDVSLNGIISGFKTQAEIDVWKVTQAEIHQKIDALYLNEKPEGIAIAFANIADREVAVNGVKVEYTIAKDATNDVLNYVVTKLSKGNAEKAIPTSDVSLNGVISGFKIIKNANFNKVTKETIYTIINNFYIPKKHRGIHDAFDDCDWDASFKLYKGWLKDGTIFEFNIIKNAAKNQLEYVVTKLIKDDVEKVIPASDVSLNGIIKGFFTTKITLIAEAWILSVYQAAPELNYFFTWESEYFISGQLKYIRQWSYPSIK